MAAAALAVAVDDPRGRFVDAIAAAAESRVVGSGLDPAVEMGPVISGQSKHRIEGLIEGSVNSGKRDANFQGFGRFLTGSSGEYYFRTIKPVPYGDASFLRTRHIHYAVHTKGRERFTTQCYVKGEPLNENDSVLKSIRDPKLRELVTVDFAPLPESPTHDLAATFDIILDVTPSA